MTTQATVPTQIVVSNDGTTIAYEKSGTGAPVVLVDGALCSRASGPARPLARELAGSYTVYSYDRRGRDESGDTAPYAPEREFEDLRAVIDAAGGDAYVYGISSGAVLALAAAGAGVPMRKLAVFEPPFKVGNTGHRAPADSQAQLQQLVDTGKRGAAVEFFMTKMVGLPFFVPYLMRLMPKTWKQLKAVAHTLPYDAAVCGDWSLPTSAIAALDVPALVMGGGKSPQHMRDAVRAVADALPGARYKELEGQTHQVAEQAMAPALRDFFR